jgi:methylated-DNA-[protein]-cysteine S-methyltransferase
MKKQPKKLLNSSRKLTDFAYKVYCEVLAIPAGKVRTYKQIAIAVKHPKAYRAVGSALKKNPFPFLIPCHRVIKSNGDIGNYIYGRNLKQKLLQAERDFTNLSF